MKNYLHIDTGGESYFYGSHLNSGCVPHFRVTLKMTIDGGILRQTMSDIMKRFPQMAVGIERQGTKYGLKHLDTPFPIFHDDATVIKTLGSEELNGYTLAVSYFGKNMHFDFLHILGDGTGFLIFIKAVVYRYLQLSGFPVTNDGSIPEVGQPYDPEEGEDAFQRIPADFPTECPDWYQSHVAFQIPGISTADDPSDTVVQIRIPFDTLHGVVKSYQSSPVTFLSPLFSHAIYERYESEIGDLPIVASVPVNMRPYFPTRTTRYFIAVAVLAHGRLFLQQDKFEDILATQKKLLSEQTKPEFLVYMARKQASGMHYFMNMPTTIDQKVEMMGQSIESSLKNYTYIFTNMCGVVLPKLMSQYVSEIYPILPTATTGYTLATTTYNNELILSITQRSEDTSICRRFVQLLNQLEIPAYIAETFKFHTMRFCPLP